MESGINLQDLLTVISKSYGKEITEVEEDLQAFLTTLVNEGIAHITEFGASDFSLIENCVNYQKPVLEKFTDMQDLILLDPVHDVNPKGWPHTDSKNEGKTN
jgi:hypothetical protein